MITREERAAGLLATGEMNGRRFAEHLGVAHGTIKRWLHEGMPARRGEHGVWISPAEASAWVSARYPRSIAIKRTSVVYVALRDDGAVKIGFTSDINRRIAELRKESRSAVELVACVPGAKPEELRLQSRFEATRLDGEWFAVDVREVVGALLGAA